MLCQRECLVDLFLDEEFGDNATDLVFKKSFADVATEEEFWQWVYGPVVGAIWSEDDSDQPGPILMSNILLGAVQFRQVRVRAMNCSEMALGEERKMLRTNDTGQMFAAPQRCNPEFRGESDADPTVSYQSFGRKDPGVPCVNGTSSCRYHHSWHESKLKGSVAFTQADGGTQVYGRGGFDVELSRSKQVRNSD